MVCLSVVFEIASKYCISDCFVDYDGYSISSKGIRVHSRRYNASELNSPIPVHFSLLIPRMLMFTLAISYLTTSNLPWFMDLTFQVPMQYCSLQHQSTSITSHICNWVLFLLWLCLFILSGVISPLISSSILGPCWPGELIFHCLIFLPFHTVHGVLKAGILKCFAIPFSSGPHFVRTLHHDLSVLSGPTWHGS